MDQNNQTGISSSVYAPKLGVSQIAPISPTAPITASSIKPATPAVVPQTQPSTIADSINGTADAALTQQKALDTKVQSEADAAKKAAESSQSDLSKTFQDIINIQSGRAQAETDAGLPTLNTQLADIAGEIEKARQAQQKEIDAVTANGSISKEGQAGLISNINTKYARSNVDLLITQDILQRKYDSAQKNVDRKIELALEPLKTKLDFQKQYYQDNKERWNDAKQKEYQNLVTQSQREYDKQKSFEEQKGTFALQALKDGNTALWSAINGAKTANDMAHAIVNNSNNGYITVNTAPEIKTALSVILGSGKFTKDQAAAVTKAINAGEDPFTVIKNQAKNIMGQTLATSLDKYESAKSQMGSIASLLTEYYANGGKTGIFTGNFEKTLNNLGQVNDPKLVGIATNIAAALQNYRNAVSGTAYSVQEGADIASIFPGINKSEGLNKAIIDARIKSLDTQIDSQYSNTLGSSYKTLKESEEKARLASQPEIDYKTQLATYKRNHPDQVAKINTAIGLMETVLGRQITAQEFYQAYPEYNQQ